MWEFDDTDFSENEARTIRSELATICDQYAEFNDYCAFFCEASRFLIMSNDEVYQSCADGAQRFSTQLIKRSQYFKARLDYLLRRVDV